MRTREGLGDEFASVLAASFVSNIGDGIRLAALPLLAATLTDSAFLIGSVTAAQFLPWTTFAPIGGVIVDRADRRRLILITQCWRAAVMVLLALAVAADVATIWHVFATAFVITVGEILVDPSVVATIPTIVSRDDLDRANGRLSVVEQLTNEFLGGPLGAATFTVAPWLPFVVDGGSYLGSTVWFRRLRPRPGADRSDAERSWASVRAEIPQGVRWILDHEFLRPWTAAVAVTNVGASAAFGLLVVLVLDAVEASEAVYGLALAGAAVGGAIGSAAAAWLADRYDRRVVLTVAGVVGAAATAGLSAAEAGWHVVAGWAGYGIGFGVLLAVGRGFVQRYTPQQVLGRTAIASRMVTRTAFVVGALVSGAIASGVGVRASFVMAGVVQGLGAVLMWRALGRAAD